MKIVVLDGYTENSGNPNWEESKKLGKLTVCDRISITGESEIISRIGDAKVVIANKTPITKNIMDACPGIKHIVMLATGCNVVDHVYIRKKRTPLSNVPSYGTASVGQFAIAMLLELCHHATHHSQAVHKGKWEHCQDWYYWDYSLIELSGKTMGIIGSGQIGQQTGRIIKAMGMNILAYGKYPNEPEKEMAKYADLDTLYVKSDVIALHCLLFPETQGIINRDAIAKTKDGVIILSNSRGPLVVEKNLVDALNSSKVFNIGLDVVSAESVKGGNPLLKARSCVITSHTSWAPKESRQRIMDHTVRNVKAYIAGSPIHVISW